MTHDGHDEEDNGKRGSVMIFSAGLHTHVKQVSKKVPECSRATRTGRRNEGKADAEGRHDLMSHYVSLFCLYTCSRYELSLPLSLPCIMLSNASRFLPIASWSHQSVFPLLRCRCFVALFFVCCSHPLIHVLPITVLTPSSGFWGEGAGNMHIHTHATHVCWCKR